MASKKNLHYNRSRCRRALFSLGPAAALSLALSTFAPELALAQCAPDGALAGTTVTCTGFDPNGYNNPNNNNLTINVAPGAQVNNGGANQAINARGDDHTFINNGSITSTVNDGVRLDLRNNVTNNGSIIGNRFGLNVNDDNVIVNNGFISGQTRAGLKARFRNTIINTGLIQGDQGVNNSGSLTLTNSGTIIGTGGTAIRFGNGAGTLNLQPGSNIQGAITFGNGTDTLNVANGLSIVNTFGGGPEILNTNGAPFVRIGDQIAVLDPTMFSASDEVITDITNGIHNAVHGRLGRFARGGFPVVTSSSALGAGRTSLGGNGSAKGDATPYSTGLQGWAHAFGGYRNHEGNGPSVDTQHLTGGLVTGADKLIARSTVAGVFIGGSITNVEHLHDAQEEDVNSLFVGLYASMGAGSYTFDMMLTGGITEHDRERQVANNLAAGGVQNATGDFDGAFISPEIALSHSTPWSR